MKYNFDEIIDRHNTNSMNMEGFRGYIFHDNDGTMKFPYADDEFIRMWVADMEFATPDFIIDAVKDRLDKRIFGYTKLFDPAYYQAFEKWCDSHYNWHCDPSHLVLSNGVVPALYELVGHICAPKDKVLFLTPSYAYFKYAADFHHQEIVCSDLKYEHGQYSMHFDDLEKKLSDPNVTLCIFCNPHNPSGRVWTPEELTRFGNLCKKHNTWVISDEIHCDIIRCNQKHTPLAKVLPDYDRVVTCMAPTKTFNMAGFMISNIIIPNADLRKAWNRDHCVCDNPLSIAGAQAAYAFGDDWLEQLKAYLDENFQCVQDYLAEHLPKALFSISEATYLAWVNLEAYFSPDENLPMFFANNAGVLLEGGNMFVQNSDCFIRLNLACPRATALEGVKRICDAVNAK